ncbi:MAG TPA: PEP-CTERM/exosortase system-associated acyltransferase [Gammaproteobacteria bacterium]|nr:PEP-CTERM/exosortase system-associated acyltransferase [Gammaproteobacteria bacterium]
MDAMVESFNEYFEVVPADDEAGIRQALHLRYQVYCLETGFEPKEAFREGLERDEFDVRAVHSLLIHKSSGLVAGTVRLVLPDPACPGTPFPVEKHCGEGLPRPLPEAERRWMAEISRFCVSREFKRRLAEPNTQWGAPTLAANASAGPERRLIPHITVGLFAAIVRMSATHGVRYWYAVMEPSLLRFLNRFGIAFQALGPPVSYRGWRQPCFAVADEVLGAMAKESPAVWRLITEKGTLWPAGQPGPAQPFAAEPRPPRAGRGG